jgi:hypothetical protein
LPYRVAVGSSIANLVLDREGRTGIMIHPTLNIAVEVVYTMGAATLPLIRLPDFEVVNASLLGLPPTVLEIPH